MGETLFERTIDALEDIGITNIVIVHNEDSTARQIVDQKKYAGIDFTYVSLPKPEGMASALLAAREYLDDTFFLLTGYHFDIADFAASINDASVAAEAVLLVKKKESFDTSGVVALEGNKVTGVIEKPRKEDAPSNYGIVGIYLLSKSLLPFLEKISQSDTQFEEAISEFARSHNVYAVKTEKETLGLKYPWDLFSIKDYLFVHMDFHRDPSAQIAKSAEITGDVFIGADAKIMEGAKIKGPCYIGKNVTVGTNALVREGSVLEDDVKVGANMEIRNSVLGRGTTTHSGFIGDSIIGEYNKIAGDISTGNVRLDRGEISVMVKDKKITTGKNRLGIVTGSNVVVGIKVATMPGILIGSGAVIGPATVVKSNVPENAKYYTKFVEIVEEQHEKT